MVITKATMADAEEILRLQKLAYRIEAEAYQNDKIAPMTEQIEQTRADFSHKCILKAVRDGVIIGSIRGNEEHGTCHVGRLMVHPDYHNRGIGTKLLLALESHFPGCRFELFTGYRSARNIHLYEKIGYRTFKTAVSEAEKVQFVFMEKAASLGLSRDGVE